MKLKNFLFWVLFLFPISGYTWLLLGPFGGEIDGPRRRGAVFLVLIAFGAWLLFRFKKMNWFKALLVVAICYAAFYKTATFARDISTYPLSLSWSEGSRYYYASLFFSERLYGMKVPTSVLHPSRYLMQSIPFLISGLPLWFHRFWQVFLWISFTLGTGYTLSKRVNAGWVFSLWAFMFLFQGPVYYHLLVMVILVLWGFKPDRFWRSMWVILAASAWAGISRVNWIPVPAILAAVIYVLEVPLAKKPLWRYFYPPAVWGLLGTGVGFLTQRLYIIWSGNPAEQFGSSFTSDLLWYRLSPSPTYPGGILRDLIWVLAPLTVIILIRMGFARRQMHWLRHAAIWMALLVLFAVGIVVSVKIGGGSNLHNMDSFLVLLLIAGSYYYFDRFAKEDSSSTEVFKPVWLLVLCAAAVPIFFAITSGGITPVRDFASVEKKLANLQADLDPVVQQGGEILLIEQRHLLTFGILKAIPLVPDYEVVFLMEMVMSKNKPYLDQFYQDLQDQRFAFIISGGQPTSYQGRAYAFGEENDIWVDLISGPMLCAYEPWKRYRELNLMLYVPRDVPCK